MKNAKSHMDNMKEQAKKAGDKMAHGMEDMKNKSKDAMHKMEDKIKSKTSHTRKRK